jgi:hypothetical protein
MIRQATTLAFGAYSSDAVVITRAEFLPAH